MNKMTKFETELRAIITIVQLQPTKWDWKRENLANVRFYSSSALAGKS